MNKKDFLQFCLNKMQVNDNFTMKALKDLINDYPAILFDKLALSVLEAKFINYAVLQENADYIFKDYVSTKAKEACKKYKIKDNKKGSDYSVFYEYYFKKLTKK